MAQSIHLRPMHAIIRRERLHSMIAEVPAGEALIFCAPLGMGKTTLLRAFAAATASCYPQDGRDLHSANDVRRCLAAAAGSGWLLIDDVDCAGPAALDEVIATISAGSATLPRIVVTGRSRTALRAGALAAAGRATVAGASELSFTIDDAAAIAAAHAVAHEPEDLAELLVVTDGWPLALAWIVRDAAARQPYLVGAFERWSERNAHLMLDYVSTESSPDRSVRLRLMAALEGGRQTSQPELSDLERAGCPIKRIRTGFAPFRLLGRLKLAADEQPKVINVLDPLTVTLFGRFECRIGPSPVVFARRRDQNVLVFLALSTDARATRAELQKAFWPGLPTAVASQGVRTTLCRLRRAIAAIVGSDVDRYFGSRGVVRLDLQNVHVDARRFREHVEFGLSDATSGEAAGRIRHFRAAERIYSGALLASESIDPAFAPRVAEFGGMFEQVAAGLADERRATPALRVDKLQLVANQHVA